MNESQINTEGIITSKYEKQIKIISLLLFLIFFMMLLSLVSFSPHDEQNAQISFVDVIKLFSGDSDLEAKASVTKNWLGLTGAKISDFIYNKTIGY